jgi:PAT family beta-lactamase induction signal transducer AmpG
MYIALTMAGHDDVMLALSIGIENVTDGLGSAAFVAYLSQLCSLEFTATQYALLSSLAVVGRTTLASSGGWLADHFGWIGFFLIATFAGLPGLLVLLWLMWRTRAPGANADGAAIAGT